MNTYQIIARLLGGLIILFQLLISIPINRKLILMQKNIMKMTIFQTNMLPFILGIGLLITAKLWLIIAALIIFIISKLFSHSTVDFFTLIFPPICGGFFGHYLLLRIVEPTFFWHILGIVVGIIIMFIFMSLIISMINYKNEQ